MDDTINRLHTMMNKLTRILLSIMLAAMVFTAARADNATRLKNYDLWCDLPSKQLMKMGADFFDAGKVDSSLVCYNIVVNRYHLGQEQDKTAAIAMNMLGVLYTHFFVDYEKAYSNLLLAEKIAHKNKYYNVLSDVYGNVANIYITQATVLKDGKDSRVAQAYLNAFDAAIECNKPRFIMTAAFNLAVNADSSSYKDFKEDIDMFLQYPIPDSLSQYTFQKYFCRAVKENYENHDYDKALYWYDKALDNVYGALPKEKELCYINIIEVKMRLLLDSHRYPEAVKLMEEMVIHGKENNDHHLLFTSYNYLSHYYHKIAKDSIVGDRYELLSLREKDLVMSKDKLIDADKAEFLFQIDRINAEAQELSHRHKIAKLIAWGVTAMALIILFFLCLLWRKYLQEQAKNRKLYENNLALLALEKERRQQLIEDEKTPKYQSHQMGDDESSDLLHRILYIMESSDEIYKDTFSLDRLTELVDARSSNYVSQVLNGHYKHSFPAVLNEYRVREACRRINDVNHFGHLTVESIAQSVGFKSYPNFINNFKKFTGLTPSAYRKQALAKA